MLAQRSHWTFRDIFLSLEIALDPMLLGTGYLGLATAGIAFGFFHFLASAAGDGILRKFLSLLGVIAFISVWILSSGIVARVVAVRLLHGRTSSPAEIAVFLRRRARTLLLLPTCFAAVVLAALLGLVLLEFLAFIPAIGPILFGAAFTLAFLLGLAATAAFALHTLGGLLYPTIVAVRPSAALEVVREILRLARARGALLFSYSVVILAAGAVSTIVLIAVVSIALAVTASATFSVLGERFTWLLAGLPSIFHPFLDLFRPAIGPVPTGMDVPLAYDLGGILIGMSLLSIFAAAGAYPFVMVNSAGTLAYFILTDEPLPGAGDDEAPANSSESEGGGAGLASLWDDEAS
jgi:hypothetical protein